MIVAAHHAHQLARRLDFLLSLRRSTAKRWREFHQEARDSGLFELTEAADEDFSWGEFYELPFNVHVYLLYQAFGIADFIYKPHASVEALIEKLKELDAYSGDPAFCLYMEDTNLHDWLPMFALQMSCIKSLDCIGIYSVPINQLIQRVREGSDLAFYRAVTIDPLVIQAPTMARRLSFALLEDDKRFLKRYRTAIYNGPNLKRHPYSELRLTRVFLEELGAFQKLSRTEIHDVVVDTLRIYGGKHGDTFKGLFGLMDSWRKDATK